jgi:carbon-monoxide dehydrogenase small subunit
MDVSVALKVNGKSVSAKVEARTLLVQLLREKLTLTGTHVGCDTSQCGACVVHVDGKAIKSCTILAAQCEGADVVTIEGLAKGDKLHPMQQAFMDNHGLQCGFCTPGMVMASIDIVRRHPNGLDEPTVRRELEGNICRCTGYHNIVKAVLDAAPKMKGM